MEVGWEARLPLSLSMVLQHALQAEESLRLEPNLSGPMDSLALDVDDAQLEVDARSGTLTGAVRDAALRAADMLRSAAEPGAVDDLLVTRRGPRQFLGALGMLDPEFYWERWKPEARALTDVEAVRLTAWGLETFLEQNPLVQVHLRASIARSQADVLKLESMEKIAECMYSNKRKQETGARPPVAPRAPAGSDDRSHGSASGGSPPAPQLADDLMNRFAVVSWLRDGMASLGSSSLNALGLA